MIEDTEACSQPNTPRHMLSAKMIITVTAVLPLCCLCANQHLLPETELGPGASLPGQSCPGGVGSKAGQELPATRVDRLTA